MDVKLPSLQFYCKPKIAFSAIFLLRRFEPLREAGQRDHALGVQGFHRFQKPVHRTRLVCILGRRGKLGNCNPVSLGNCFKCRIIHANVPSLLPKDITWVCSYFVRKPFLFKG
jgi:hypothetical protein